MKYIVHGLSREFDSPDLTVALGFAFEAACNLSHTIAVYTPERQVVAIVKAPLSGFRAVSGEEYIVPGHQPFPHINHALRAAYDASDTSMAPVSVLFDSAVRIRCIAVVEAKPYELRA